MRQHRMVGGETDRPAGGPDAARAGPHPPELDALPGLVDLDPVERAVEIEMPPGPPELAVGRSPDADPLLPGDGRRDLPVLDRAQRVRVDLAAGAPRAGLLERRRAQQAADMVGAEGRGRPGHPSGSFSSALRRPRRASICAG